MLTSTNRSFSHLIQKEQQKQHVVADPRCAANMSLLYLTSLI